jgi:hypothetical protein
MQRQDVMRAGKRKLMLTQTIVGQSESCKGQMSFAQFAKAVDTVNKTTANPDALIEGQPEGHCPMPDRSLVLPYMAKF